MKKLRLLENGLCFIIQSIRHFEYSEKEGYNPERELKYSCLCLFSGVFLILKEKLSQEHWSLLFSDVNKANRNDLESGNFRGVNFEDCQKRLSKIVSVEFKEKRTLESLREKRNKIEHFFESESLLPFKSTLAKNLSFVLNFVDKHLKSNRLSDYKDDMETIKTKCFALENFVSERLKEIKPEIEAQKVILYCSRCENKTIVPIDESSEFGMKCLFCLRFIDSDQYNELDKLYYDSLDIVRTKDYLGIDKTFCCECESEDTLVDTKDKKNYFCLSCHYTAEKDLFSLCSGCGVIYQDNMDDSGQCPSCWERLIHQ